MNFSKKYFLGSFLAMCLVFATASMVSGISFPTEEVRQEATEDFDPGLDVISEDVVSLLDEQLAEEQALAGLSKEGSSLSDMAAIALPNKKGTDNMASLESTQDTSDETVSDEEEIKTESTVETDEADIEETAEDTSATDGDETGEAEESTEPKKPVYYTAYERIFCGRIIADPDKLDGEVLHIRKDPDWDAETVGKLAGGAWASKYELDESGVWLRIKSGNVTGWVCYEYVVDDPKAMSKLALTYGGFFGTITTERLNVRAVADAASECIGSLHLGDVVNVYDQEPSDWVKIDYSGREAYISREFVTLEYKLPVAMTLEEEQAYLEQKALADRDNQVAAAINASASRGGTSRSALYISYDDAYLLGCVLDMESQGQSYDFQLAVMNVILNRYYSGIWGNTFYDIIYSPGQFTGAGNGLLSSHLAVGPSATSMQVVYDACAGYNNIGDYKFFCTPGKAGSVNAAYGTFFGPGYFYNLGY